MTPQQQLLSIPDLSPEERRFLEESFQTQAPLVSPSGGGLLSSAKSAGRGLLDFGRSVGGGLMSGARAVGQNIDAEQLQKDIIDTQRFYQQAMMSQPRQVLGKDLGMLKNITPAGIAASLPSLRAQEASALQKPMIEELEAMAALERAKQTQGASSGRVSAMRMMTPSGKIIDTIFDKESLQRIYIDDEGNKVPIPEGSLNISKVGIETSKPLQELNESIRTDSERLRALDRFAKSVSASPEGFGRIMSQIDAAYNAFTASDKPSEFFTTTQGKAQLQGLIGRFKDEVVGGGVMTEQDALRIIEFLGGSFSATTPKSVTLKQISDLREETQSKYSSQIDRFNALYSFTPAQSAAKIQYKPYTIENKNIYTIPSSLQKTSDDDKEPDPLGIRN